MAGRRHRSFRSGDLNEELGILLLKGVAAVAGVPRPEDVGIDAVATLLREAENNLLVAENSFYVQFKSSADRKVVFAEHEVRWLESLKLPFFVGSVRKQDSAIDLYATHRLSQVILEGAHQEIHLFLDNRDELKVGPNMRGVNIGPPLLSWSTVDLATPEFPLWAYSILKPYLEAEQRNIDCRELRYIETITWETGNPPNCQQGFMHFQSGKSDDDILRVFRSMGPHIHALATRAIMKGDRNAMRLCLELIEYLRNNGFDADPNRRYQSLYDQWDSSSAVSASKSSLAVIGRIDPRTDTA